MIPHSSSRRPLIAVLVTLVLLTALLFCMQATTPAAGQESTLTSTGLDVVVLLDNSVSMEDRTDPKRLRVEAGRFLVDYLRATTLGADMDVRIGVISFGSELGIVQPLIPLNDPGLQSSIQAERLAYTDFRQPLQAALDQLNVSGDEGRKKAVILFTDGHPQLTQADASWSPAQITQYFQGLEPLAQELQDSEIDFFVIGIGDAVSDKENWREIFSPERYYSLTSPSQLSSMYHDIVARLLNIQISTEEILLSGISTSIEVESFLERVIIVCLTPNASNSVILADPSGQVIVPSPGEQSSIGYNVYTIPSPAPGRWTLTAAGSSNVSFWVDRQLPQATLNVDAPAPYLGQPITMTASVLRSGVVITASLTLEAIITDTAGARVVLPLMPLVNGQYQSIWTPSATGTYTLGVSARVGERVITRPVLPIRQEIVASPVILPVATSVPTASPTIETIGVTTVVPIPTAISDNGLNSINSLSKLTIVSAALTGFFIIVTVLLVYQSRKTDGLIKLTNKSEKHPSDEQLIANIKNATQTIDEEKNKNKRLQRFNKTIEEIADNETKHASRLGEEKVVKEFIIKGYKDLMPEVKPEDNADFHKKILSTSTGVYVLARYLIDNWTDKGNETDKGNTV